MDKTHRKARRAHVLGKWLASTALMGGLFVAPAFAQETTPGATQTKRGVNEILVTTNKRGVVSAQRLASSITAFDADKLERLDALDFDDFIVQVPGTNFIDNGGPGRGNEVASIRGLSPVADNTVSVVAQYLDGAPRFGRNYRLFDIGEVSVLRGPQGTLWGTQALGGLISFQSNRPDSTGFDAMLQTDLYTTRGDGGLSYRVGGHVNIPIVQDKLAIRVAGHHIDESGYIDNVLDGRNDVNDVDEAAWRVSVQFDPTDWASFTLIYHGNDLSADASSYFSLGVGDRKSIDKVSRLPADQEYDLVNLLAEIDLGWGTLNYAGSYFNQSNTFFDVEDDVFGIPGFLGLIDNTLEQESWTHELRLSSNGDNRFDWIIGVYYDDLEENNLSVQSEIVDPNDPLAMPIFGTGFEIFAIGGPEDSDELAFFGEVSFDVTDQFEILVGGRYYDWSVNNAQENTFFGTDFSVVTGKVGDDDTLFKVQVNYRPTDDALLYALRSEGFRRGGFNPFVGPVLGIPDTFVQFDPDSLVNYEIGAKTAWLDNQLILNGSVYYMDWKDIQTVVFNSLGTFAFTTNGPDLEAYGLELEAVTQDLFMDGVYAAATYAFNKNEFTEDAAVFPGTPFLIADGDELRRTPRSTWSFDLGYETQIGGFETFFRANYWHKDSTSTDGFNSGDGMVRIPAQDVFNLSAGITRNGWQAKLYVDNITNDDPLLQVFPDLVDPTSPARASSIRPRTIGIELTKRFGG